MTIANFLVLCQSEVKTKTALFTIEAYNISMPYRCRELFPITGMLDLLGHSVVLPFGYTTMILSIHKGNAGSFVLVEII